MKVLEAITDSFVAIMGGEWEVNNFRAWKDNEGITHAYVFDTSSEYQLINGEWVELPPF